MQQFLQFLFNYYVYIICFMGGLGIVLCLAGIIGMMKCKYQNIFYTLVGCNNNGKLANIAFFYGGDDAKELAEKAMMHAVHSGWVGLRILRRSDRHPTVC